MIVGTIVMAKMGKSPVIFTDEVNTHNFLTLKKPTLPTAFTGYRRLLQHLITRVYFYSAQILQIIYVHAVFKF